MNLTYEELYEKYYKLIRKESLNYKFKTDREDVLQDFWINVFVKQDKILNQINSSSDPAAYICVCSKHYFVDYIKEEHKKGLWLETNAFFENTKPVNVDLYYETSVNSKGEICVVDEYIKTCRKRHVEANTRYRQKIYKDPEKHKKYLEYKRQYYKKRKETDKQKYEDDLKKGAIRSRAYYEQNKEKHKIYCREWYQNIKENEPERYRKMLDKRNESARMRRKKKKEEKLNGKTI